MLLTEEEAKFKWCPMPIPKGTDLDNWSCAGPRCMAWRWGESAIVRRHFVRCGNGGATDEPETSGIVPSGYEWVPCDENNDFEPAGWIEPETEANKRRKGYCGLAGKVEYP